MDSLIIDRFASAFESFTDEYEAEISLKERGIITALSEGIVHITGFQSMRLGERIRLPDGAWAIAEYLAEDGIGAAILSQPKKLAIGMSAERTYQKAYTAIGNELLGRVVNPLGEALDENGALKNTKTQLVEKPAPAIIDRDPVRRPLLTGIKAIDAIVPIGRGQRELILGDRQTGKTTLAVDAILSQKEDVISVYCAIGQRQSTVNKVIQKLKKADALKRCIVVVASGDDLPGLRYLAPFAATTMAEYFMESGQDALIIYDDLTQHARAYREVSLLLNRPPGREAYPGDIFYLHARLLERATQLRESLGGGSLTALPIIETQAQNISSYIATNLISISDGQIFLSATHFEKALLPAVDISRSVSRVGAKGQPAAFRGISSDLRPLYAQFEELESFARFGTRLDERSASRLMRGRCVRESLKQDEGDALSVREQIAVILAAVSGLFDPIPLENITDAEAYIRNYVEHTDKALWKGFTPDEVLSTTQKDLMVKDLEAVLVRFETENMSKGDDRDR